MASKKKSSSDKKDEPDGLTGITVSGFKSLAKPTHIDLRRLTVLAGANNSGKSSIIQPLLLLKQTLDAPIDPGPLKISGPNVSFTDVEQFTPNIPNIPHPRYMQIGLELGRSSKINFKFRAKPGRNVDVVELFYEDDNKQTLLKPSMTHAEIVKQLPKELLGVAKAFKSGKRSTVKWEVVRERFLLNARLMHSNKVIGEEILDLLGLSVSPGGRFANQIKRMIHVPGLRGNPERFYRTSAIGPDFPGSFSEYVASIIRHWKDNEKDELDQLGSALAALGLSWKVDPVPLDSTRVEIRVGRLPQVNQSRTSDLVNIADVGFGVSQVLPVVVALLAAEKNQLVYIEQPEIHLHPRAEGALAELLAKAANRGVRLIVETHSSLLLLALQTLVAKGDLHPDRVKLHWFSRDARTGITKIRSADVDDIGAFGQWPVDFVDVHLEAENQYLDVAEQRLKRRAHAAE